MRSKSINDPLGDWDENIDIENTEAMKRIVEEIGWPTVSKVGQEASDAAWLLVQHADHNPEFQQLCIELMKNQAEGEVRKSHVAYLEDRVRVNTKREQLYGTQFRETQDENGIIIKYEPRPIEDREHVNKRRALADLDTLEEYTEILTRHYYPHLLDTKSE